MHENGLDGYGGVVFTLSREPKCHYSERHVGFGFNVPAKFRFAHRPSPTLAWAAATAATPVPTSTYVYSGRRGNFRHLVRVLEFKLRPIRKGTFRHSNDE